MSLRKLFNKIQYPKIFLRFFSNSSVRSLVFYVVIYDLIAVNQFLFATTSFRDLTEIRWLATTFLRSSLLHTWNLIASIQQRVVRRGKYLWRRGSREPRKYFLRANQIVFTVIRVGFYSRGRSFVGLGGPGEFDVICYKKKRSFFSCSQYEKIHVLSLITVNVWLTTHRLKNIS